MKPESTTIINKKQLVKALNTFGHRQTFLQSISIELLFIACLGILYIVVDVSDKLGVLL